MSRKVKVTAEPGVKASPGGRVGSRRTAGARCGSSGYQAAPCRWRWAIIVPRWPMAVPTPPTTSGAATQDPFGGQHGAISVANPSSVSHIFEAVGNANRPVAASVFSYDVKDKVGLVGFATYNRDGSVVFAGNSSNGWNFSITYTPIGYWSAHIRGPV